MFRLPDATAGVWTLRVEMLGFEQLTREITVTPEPQPSAWMLTLKPFDEITRGLPPPPPPAAQPSSQPAARAGRVLRPTPPPRPPGAADFSARA